jgi:NAD(P)-dependent dehydrogenase (short-subunit alcohol dehydrogenase family)
MNGAAHSLVIGGTRGLGRAVARLLQEAGHRVSAIGRRQPEQPDARVDYWLRELDDDVGVKAILAQVLEQSGPLNYVVFCQRYRGQGDPWTGELNVTLTLTRTVIETLRTGGWAAGDKGMVMVSSVFGEWIGAGQPAAYHVAKAGLLQLMRYYAVELGPQGIRANAVTPFTFLKDESQSFYLANDALMDVYRQSVPLGRLATTDEIARVIRFLCSSEASYLTGQNLHVDGGLSAVWPETLARRLKGV